jgi:hypothetical protein
MGNTFAGVGARQGHATLVNAALGMIYRIVSKRYAQTVLHSLTLRREIVVLREGDRIFALGKEHCRKPLLHALITKAPHFNTEMNQRGLAISHYTGELPIDIQHNKVPDKTAYRRALWICLDAEESIPVQSIDEVTLTSVPLLYNDEEHAFVVMGVYNFKKQILIPFPRALS